MDKEELIKLTSKININSCPKIVNFHCHSIYSDGSLTPEELLDEAYKNNIQYFSITDHHTVKAHKYISSNNLLNKLAILFIMVITNGPKDTSKTYELTDWNRVDNLIRRIDKF